MAKSSALENGRKALARGDLHRAATYLRIAIGEMEQRDRIPAEAGTANADLGRILQASGDVDGAVYHLVRGVYLLDRGGRHRDLYAALLDLAAVHRVRGENRMALRTRLQAARLRAQLAAGRVASTRPVSMTDEVDNHVPPVSFSA